MMQLLKQHHRKEAKDGPEPSLKDKAAAFLNPTFIAAVARRQGLAWRETSLALPRLVSFFARQVLGGNLSMPQLARLGGSLFTPEAYCTARMKLPVSLLRCLLEEISQLSPHQLAPHEPALLWKGHRLWHMDGTGVSMPDTPALQRHFGQSGQQKPGCGFPVAHLLCLFDAATGLLRDCIIAPLRTHDMADASKLHKYLAPGDILVANRAFESFVHLALLLAAGLHAIVPAHHGRRIDFRCRRRHQDRHKRPLAGGRQQPPIYDREVLRKCGHRDHIVRWRKPPKSPPWLSPEEFDALPETIEVRELRRAVLFPDGRKRQITLVTTLCDEQRYPPEALLQVLKARWQVDGNLRHLKTTMKMDVLRSQTVEGIERELWMYAIVYNAVRLVMLEAADKQEVTIERISFADALYWLRHGGLLGSLPPLQIIPYRPNRLEPRVRKRRNDKYKLMTQPRSLMRQALLRKGVRP